MTEIAFQYFDGCPNWQITHERLKQAIEGLGVKVVMQLVETPEEAAEVGFRGSPTVLIDGVDPFADPDTRAAGALACRVYRTEDGSPTVEQLRDALALNG
jgi:hypothetical protein